MNETRLPIYQDVDGNEVTLDVLCRREPEWAANVIRQLREQRDRARANLRVRRDLASRALCAHWRLEELRNFDTALADEPPVKP